jgi:hypothetical protein
MPRPKKPNPMPARRPQKKIDWDEVDKCLLAQVPGTWIAASIGVHPETLYERCQIEKGMGFSAYSQSKMSHGKTIAMKKQFGGVLNGNVALSLHWAAHHLDQPNKSTVKQEIKQEVTQRVILKLPDNGNRVIEPDKVNEET